MKTNELPHHILERFEGMTRMDVTRHMLENDAANENTEYHAPVPRAQWLARVAAEKVASAFVVWVVAQMPALALSLHCKWVRVYGSCAWVDSRAWCASLIMVGCSCIAVAVLNHRKFHRRLRG